MGIFSAIGSFIGGCCSFVSNAISTIGYALGTAAISLLKIAGNSLGTIIKTIEKVGIALDVLKPDDDIEKIGAKAMVAEKKVEDFEYVSDYIEYLKKDVELDKEAFEKSDKKEKMARKAVGATIVSKGIEEKKDVSISEEFWVEAARHKMEVKEIDAIIDSFKENNIDNKLGSFFKGELSYKESKNTSKILIETYQKLEPNLTIEEIKEKIMGMEDLSRKGEEF